MSIVYFNRIADSHFCTPGDVFFPRATPGDVFFLFCEAQEIFLGPRVNAFWPFFSKKKTKAQDCHYSSKILKTQVENFLTINVLNFYKKLSYKYEIELLSYMHCRLWDQLTIYLKKDIYRVEAICFYVLLQFHYYCLDFESKTPCCKILKKKKLLLYIKIEEIYKWNFYFSFRIFKRTFVQ